MAWFILITMVRTRQSAPTCQGCDRGNDYHAARIGSVTDPVSTEPISCSHLRTRCLAADRSLATPATHIKVRVQSAERKSALTTRRPPRAASAHQSSCAEHPPRARLGTCGARIDKRLSMWRRSLTLRSEAARRRGGRDCRTDIPNTAALGRRRRHLVPTGIIGRLDPAGAPASLTRRPERKGADTSSRSRTTGRPQRVGQRVLEVCGCSYSLRTAELPRQGPPVPSDVSEAA